MELRLITEYQTFKNKPISNPVYCQQTLTLLKTLNFQTINLKNTAILLLKNFKEKETN